MNLYLYSQQAVAHGVSIIKDNFIDACKRLNVNCGFISSLEKVHEDDIVIPYGVKESSELLNLGLTPNISMLIDAVSLGYRNKVLFYLRHFNIFQYDFLYSIFAYLKYSRKEKQVCNKYEKLILVSPTDIKYLVKTTGQPINKFIYVPNGVNLHDSIKPKTKSTHLRLGLLASWGAKQTFAESEWFVKEYFSKYHKTHPDVILKLIGRGTYINKLRGIPGVEILGAVESLNEAFADIDIFIGANPKGCGVLNRCLDAMSFKTPILALPECFSGIPNAENLYYQYTDYVSFSNQVDHFDKYSKDTLEKTQLAFEYVKCNNDWIKNYNILVEELFDITDFKNLKLYD